MGILTEPARQQGIRERWRQRGRRLSGRVAGLGDVIRADLSSDRVLERSVEQLHTSLGCSWTSTWVAEGEGLRCAHGLGRSPLDGLDAPSIVAEAVNGRRAAVDPLRGEIAVPLVHRERGVQGALHLAGHMWTADEVAFVEAIARETGLALEAAQLYEEVVQAKETVEAILQRVGDGVVVTNGAGVVRRWSPAATRLTGCEPDDAVGRRCAEVLGLARGERHLDCAAGCALLDVEDGPVVGEELWRQVGEGHRQPLLATVEPVRDPDGNVVEVVHTLRDITRLKQADEAKTLFLATASHELRTPLTVMRGFADALVRNPDMAPDSRRSALEAIARRAAELEGVVDRLLLSSRIESGRVEVHLEAIDLAPVLEERTLAMSTAAGRLVETDVEEPLPEALADPQAVITVVEHLLDNAMKYSPGGEVIAVEARRDGDAVLVLVTDRGTGMDREQVARCFDKFWQGETGEARRFGGTGIGLYIVRSLVEAMGGRVHVTSERGRGSTFAVRLPCAEPSTASAPEGRADPSVIKEFMRQVGIPERR